MIEVKDLKPVTVRKIIVCNSDKNDYYEEIKDGYEWNGIFIPQDWGVITRWFINDLRKYSQIENYTEVLPRKADNLRVELKEHDIILDDDWFSIIEDKNPDNTAIKLHVYRVSIAFEHDDEGYSFPVVTHNNKAKSYENNDKAVDDIERWIKIRLGKYTPKATYFISRKDIGFEKRGILTA